MTLCTRRLSKTSCALHAKSPLWICPLTSYCACSFAGMPADEQAQYDVSGHIHKGDFACNAQDVLDNLRVHNVMLYPGLFPETAQGLERLEFSFVHVDCDRSEERRV